MSIKDDTKISQEVLDMSAVIEKGLTISKGEVSVADNLYISTLPDGLTEEQVKAVQSHNSVFFPAASLALGNVGIPVLKKDQKVERLTAGFNMIGKDEFSVSLDRMKTSHNPQSTTEKPLPDVVNYGVLSASYTTHGARATVGQMGHVRAHLKAAALKAYGE